MTLEEQLEFQPFAKIARLSRDCVVTEKIDGTNAQIVIAEDGGMRFASRTRYITPDDDNFGFARWASDNAEDLRKLGPGRHYGEWWGSGIQRRYDQQRKRFSLFNTARWTDDAARPLCCDVVPELYRGPFDTAAIEGTLDYLRNVGSIAAPGFLKPEGIVIWHEAARTLFKKTIEKDAEPKGARR